MKEFLAELETDGNKQILRIYIVFEKGKTQIEKNLSYVLEDTKGQVAIIGPTYSVNVEKGVYGNLYKISNEEYHLIFNSTGFLAQGYTEEQLVAKGTNIKDGSGRKEVSDEKYISTQPWGPYSEKIKKVKIEETIKPANMLYYFVELSKITEIEGIYNIDTSNVISMRGLFYGCEKLENIDFSRWSTNNVTTMWRMFYGCSNLTRIDVSNWSTNNVTDMSGMFCGCSNLTRIDVSNWNISNLTDMAGVFYGCSNLTSINVSKWNTSNVVSMSGTFYGCSKLESIDVSNWSTNKVTNMWAMFYNCSSLKKIYAGNNWSTRAVTSSNGMFYGCTSLNGAISYDSTKTNATYANYTTGYLTYKATEL